MGPGAQAPGGTGIDWFLTLGVVLTFGLIASSLMLVLIASSRTGVSKKATRPPPLRIRKWSGKGRADPK